MTSRGWSRKETYSRCRTGLAAQPSRQSVSTAAAEACACSTSPAWVVESQDGEEFAVGARLDAAFVCLIDNVLVGPVHLGRCRS
eukprot:5352606-Pleurochrysis_carterae.AAC.1